MWMPKYLVAELGVSLEQSGLMLLLPCEEPEATAHCTGTVRSLCTMDMVLVDE